MGVVARKMIYSDRCMSSLGTFGERDKNDKEYEVDNSNSNNELTVLPRFVKNLLLIF